MGNGDDDDNDVADNGLIDQKVSLMIIIITLICEEKMLLCVNVIIHTGMVLYSFPFIPHKSLFVY